MIKQLEIVFNLDDECEICQRGLDKLAALSKIHPGFYMDRNIKSGEKAGKLELLPDYNSNGILTHWHVR